MLWLKPKEEKFQQMFAAATQNIKVAADLLGQIIEKGDQPQLKAEEIKRLEQLGDKITHEIIDKLNQTFVTPFDREDIHALGLALDDLLDFIDDAANRLIIYRIPAPCPDALPLAKTLIAGIEQIAQAIASLPQVKALYPHCVEINRLENEGDALFEHALVRLFENHQDPLAIIKLKDFYEDLEEAIDCCEDVADVLEAISVKNQ